MSWVNFLEPILDLQEYIVRGGRDKYASLSKALAGIKQVGCIASAVNLNTAMPADIYGALQSKCYSVLYLEMTSIISRT